MYYIHRNYNSILVFIMVKSRPSKILVPCMLYIVCYQLELALNLKTIVTLLKKASY